MGSVNTPLGRCHLLGYFLVLLNQGMYLCEKMYVHIIKHLEQSHKHLTIEMVYPRNSDICSNCSVHFCFTWRKIESYIGPKHNCDNPEDCLIGFCWTPNTHRLRVRRWPNFPLSGSGALGLLPSHAPQRPTLERSARSALLMPCTSGLRSFCPTPAYLLSDIEACQRG